MAPTVKPIFSRVLNRVKDFAYDKFKYHFPSPPARIIPTTYHVVYPQEVSVENSVPGHIDVPGYARGEEETPPLEPILKSAEQVKLLKHSCRLARKMLNAAKKQIRVGMTTDELDKYIHDLIIKHKAYPSPLRYHDFPKSICTSVNNVVCHGIPDNRPLANGDIVTVDVTVYYRGYHGDCAATFLVGEVDDEGQYLVEKADQILMKTISVCKPAVRMDLIGEMITCLASEAQLTVIPCVYGHGIGQYFHELPSVNHYVELENIEIGNMNFTQKMIEEPDSFDEVLVPGLTFTIEPVFGTGSQETELLEDGWTVVTIDNSRTAQFEHTIMITKTGAEILTK